MLMRVGAVISTEIKNNAFKLARWTGQAILAGADQMKIGWVPAIPSEYMIYIYLYV